MGGAPSSEGWHQHHSAGIGNLIGEVVDLFGALNDLETVAQPLDHGAGIEKAAFKAVDGDSVCIGPPQGAQQPGVGPTDLVAGVDHEEGSGAVRAFAFSGLQAELSEGGGLLIPEHGLDRQPFKGQACGNMRDVSSAGQQIR